MDSRVENSERSLPERRKGYQIRLDEIKQLWKRRKGDYLRRRSRRDHAPTRRRRTPTIHTEDEKDLEAEWETLTAHGSFEVKPENREVLPTTEEGEEPPLEPETLGKEGESVSEAVVETENGVRCDRSSVLSQSTELAAERMAARRGCRPPMDLFRSETMRLVQFIIPMDSAHRTVSYLGDLGLLQFKDLKAEKKRSMEGLQATPSPPPEPPDTISLSTTFPRPLPPPKPPDRGMLVVEVGIFHDLGEMLLFPATEECGRDERAKEIRAVGLLMFSGHTADLMGLGRTSSFNSTPFINEGRLSKEETKMGLVIYGPHPMSQTELETVGGNSLAFATRPYGNKDEEPKNEGKHNMQRYYVGSASVEIVQRWSSWLVKRNIGSPTEATVGTWKCALIMFDKITVCEIRERIVEFTDSSSFGNCPDFFYYFGHLHVPIPLILEIMIQDQIRNIGNGNNMGEDESRLVMWSLIQLAVAVLPVAIACKGLQIIVEIDEQERHYDGSSYGKFGVMMPKSQAGLFSSYLIVPKVSDHENWDPGGSRLGTLFGAICFRMWGQDVEKKSWANVTAIWPMRLIGGVSDPSLILPLDFAICGLEATAASKISIQECPRLIDNGFIGGLHIDELTLKIYKQEEHPCNREVVGLLVFQPWDPGGSKISRWKRETFHVAAREIQFSVRSFRLWDPGGLC